MTESFTAMQETPGPDEDMPAPEARTGALIVLLPAETDPTVTASSEDAAHLTFIWMGDVNELAADAEELEQAVRIYAQDLDGPIVVPVRERGLLGDEDADVLFLEPTDALIAARDGLLANELVRAAHDGAEQYPEWTPHVTLGYPEGVEGGPAVADYTAEEVTFDRVGLWLGADRYEFPMGGVAEAEQVTASADAFDMAGIVADVALPEPGLPAEEAELQDEPEDDDEELILEIPVHGVLAPEGVESGDGRGFRPGALSARNLPVPLRYEKVGTHGGQTSEVVTVGRIDKVWREGNEMRFTGVILLTKEYANPAIEGILDGSGRGVSIDADAMSVDAASFTDEAVQAATAAGRRPTTWFSETRIAGLTIVPIPALQEAYIGLGYEFPEDMTEEQLTAAAQALEDCGCGDADEAAAAVTAAAGSFAPGTKDGPGWITHPVPTSRIRRYWVRGEGAAKIRWGAPGDFNRCRAQLAKYVPRPDWLAGLCANMHKEALGIWPGEHRGAHALAASAADGREPAPIMTLVAAASAHEAYPAEFFADPKLREVTNLHIDPKTRRVWGHLAQWSTCHVGVNGACIRPPRSRSSYANFLKGVVETTAGEQRVGVLTQGIGHADPRLRAAAATAHYDQLDAVWAYVNIGEDSFGIWYSGVLADEIDDFTVRKIRAVGAISGDWRAVGKWGLDLVAAVAVNTPGYPVSIAASAGEQTSLVAAGSVDGVTIVGEDLEPAVAEAAEAEVDENAAYVARIAALAVREIREQEARASRTAALRSRILDLRQRDVRARIERI